MIALRHEIWKYLREVFKIVTVVTIRLPAEGTPPLINRRLSSNPSQNCNKKGLNSNIIQNSNETNIENANYQNII